MQPNPFYPNFAKQLIEFFRLGNKLAIDANAHFSNWPMRYTMDHVQYLRNLGILKRKTLILNVKYTIDTDLAKEFMDNN